ncbi:MAG TPA: hypothetical protein VFG23_10110 [Polyangia bacterium]|nr:hypothetical protein [Polyangia bacterium]
MSTYLFGQKVKLAMGAGNGGGVSGTAAGRSVAFDGEPGTFRSPTGTCLSAVAAVRLAWEAGFAAAAPRPGLLLGDFPPAFA